MEKFKITVVRTDEFEISVDPAVWTESELESWSKTFHDVDSREELAKSLAEQITRQGDGQFIEGFGNVKQVRENGSEVYNYQGMKDGYNPGIEVTLISHDDNYEVESEEVEP